MMHDDDIELRLELESRFGVYLSKRRFLRLRTVGDLCRSISRRGAIVVHERYLLLRLFRDLQKAIAEDQKFEKRSLKPSMPLVYATARLIGKSPSPKGALALLRRRLSKRLEEPFPRVQPYATGEADDPTAGCMVLGIMGSIVLMTFLLVAAKVREMSGWVLPLAAVAILFGMPLVFHLRETERDARSESTLADVVRRQARRFAVTRHEPQNREALEKEVRRILCKRWSIPPAVLNAGMTLDEAMNWFDEEEEI